jgi:hypothetical protein
VKKIVITLSVLALVLALASCGTTVSSLVGQATSGAVSKAVEGETAEFKADEVLCGNGDSMMDTNFYLAKVLTPASAQTKNQAEVIYVRDGKKEWVVNVLPSHKARKDEMQVGAVVLYPGGWAEYDSMGAEEYRKARWELGRITSTDEMFKNVVEVKGAKFYLQLLRMPNQPIKE